MTEGTAADFLFIPFAAASELDAQTVALASARYRAILPAQALQAAGHAVQIRDFSHPATAQTADRAKLVVLMQPKEQMLQPGLAETYWPALLTYIARQRAAGSHVALDVSDLKLGDAHHAALRARLGGAIADLSARVYSALARAADICVVPTPALQAALQAELPPGIRIEVIPDPVEVPRAPPRFAPGTILRLLWFGTFGSHAAAVMRMLQDDLTALRPPAALTLVCEPLAAALLEQVRQMAGPVKMQHRPWSVPDLTDALADADAVLLPFDTASPLARGKSNNRALQALQAGRLFLAHPVESYLPLAGFGYVGPSLHAGLAAAIADPAAIERRIAEGQAHLDKYYTPAAIARQWAALL